jgi:hypothetical protein
MFAMDDKRKWFEKVKSIQAMERGKLCRMRRGSKVYYNHQAWVKGRNQVRYVQAEDVPALREALKGYKKILRLVEEYAEAVIRETRKAKKPKE